MLVWRNTPSNSSRQGLNLRREHIILVDTKYEFGLVGDKYRDRRDPTPDSSRFWWKVPTKICSQRGKIPESSTRIFPRVAHGPRIKGDGPSPKIPDDVRVELAQRYVKAYETITGATFKPIGGNTPIIDRIKKSLAKYIQNNSFYFH